MKGSVGMGGPEEALWVGDDPAAAAAAAAAAGSEESSCNGGKDVIEGGRDMRLTGDTTCFCLHFLSRLWTNPVNSLVRRRQPTFISEWGKIVMLIQPSVEIFQSQQKKQAVCSCFTMAT